jgi:hypothetical protein
LSIGLFSFSACGGDPQDATAQTASTSEESAGKANAPIPAEPPELVAELMKPFHGDFDAMVEERVIRVLVTFNRTNFFLDGATQRGISADVLREFEKSLNGELRLGASRSAHPVPRGGSWRYGGCIADDHPRTDAPG